MSPNPALKTIAILPKRLKPPATLSDLARKEFIRIVTAEPPAHFKPSDLSLLVQYCEAAALKYAPCLILDAIDGA